jgi:ABC-type multidrug transport system fused ATPase/permease subunit
MLLDEATASMDLGTEETIRKIIDEDFKSSTMIIIAHRISTVMKCDRILVLDNGEVAEFDTPDNLRANPESLFSKLTDDLLVDSNSHPDINEK